MKKFTAAGLFCILALPALAQTGTVLPLDSGFYVSADTACGNASNATLSLVSPAGINGAREFCEFTSIRQTGATTFETVQSCAEIAQGHRFEVSTTYTVTDPRSYSFVNDDGWTGASRFCAQSDLPEPWRNIELP